ANEVVEEAGPELGRCHGEGNEVHREDYAGKGKGGTGKGGKESPGTVGATGVNPPGLERHLVEAAIDAETVESKAEGNDEHDAGEQPVIVPETIEERCPPGIDA